jgi:hypothetical protein
LNRIDPPTFAPRYFLKKNLLAEVQSYSDVEADHLPHSTNQETIKMKLALIGAAAIAAAAFAAPALAQAVVADPGYCSQFYYSANCLNLGSGNPYADGGYYRDPQNANAVISHQVAESNAYRYHGGPKYND